MLITEEFTAPLSIQEKSRRHTQEGDKRFKYMTNEADPIDTY